MATDNKIILTDCDGVLLDWEAEFHNWMSMNGYKQVEFGLYEIDLMYGIERTVSKRLIKEFNNSSWVGYMPAFGDARSGVARLVEAGYKFVCITSLSLCSRASQLRKENLEKVFGADTFIDVVCLDTGADKDEALLPYKDSGLYWVEDKDENALVGYDLGLKSILLEHNHNVDYKSYSLVPQSKVPRLANWNAIADAIISG
jgi:hypothetical protein